MSVFLEIADQYAVADAAFADAERKAFQDNNDAEFDRAGRARQLNDQAYLLHLFTRYEAAVNSATETLLDAQRGSGTPWSECRIWQAWSRVPVRDIAFLSKVEVLTDKGRTDYARAKEFYDGRTSLLTRLLAVQFFLPDVAQRMHDMVRRFVTS